MKKQTIILRVLLTGLFLGILPVHSQIHQNYPRIFQFHFDRANPEWYAQFDFVHGNTGTYNRLAELNPNVKKFNSKDWKIVAEGSIPDEWLLRDSNGNAVYTVYGPRPDMSNYCPRVASEGNKRYNEWVIDHVYEYMGDTRLDGYICQGVHIYPDGVSNVDLDRNGVNDYDEHGIDWIKEKWQEGLNHITTTIMPWFKEHDKIFILNSGFFHTWQWPNSNGLMIEKGYVPTAFHWFQPMYEGWMETAPEPHAFIWDIRGQTKDSFWDMRFMLSYCLLGDAYFSFTTWDAGEHRYVYYYDEYDVPLGSPASGVLSLSNDVKVRYFDGGVVIVNGTGAPQDVSDADLQSQTGTYYNGPYYRFIGGQDPEWNDGSEFTSMTLAGYSHEYKHQSGDGLILVNTPQYVVADIYLDDCYSGTSPATEDPVFIGSWTRGDQIGAEYWCQCNRPHQNLFAFMYTYPGDGESEAIYTPTIGVAGNYEVFEWHGYMGNTPEHISEATDVPYKITYANGMSSSGSIDQSANYGQWNSMGTFYFEAGTTNNITINNNANGMVLADAFKLVFRGADLDSENPNPPRNLYAASVTENSIALAWTEPVQADDGDVASAYLVFKDGVLLGSPAATYFTDTDLEESTTYSYTIYAVDNGGNRSVSGVSGTYTTASDVTGPSILSVDASSVSRVSVKFDEDVEQATAENGLNYTIEPAITVFTATLQADNRTVELATSAHIVGANYTVYVSNVRDRALSPNPVLSGTSANYVGYAGAMDISITGDDEYELYVNGTLIGTGDAWVVAQNYVVPSIGGKNVIAVKCDDISDKGGFLAEIEFNGTLYVTDNTWRISTTEQSGWNTVSYDDLSWPKASEYGLHGVALPWSQYQNVSGISTENGAQWIWSSDQQNHDTVYFRLNLSTGGDITPPTSPQGVTVTSQQ
jgi:hypothetical protein